MIGSAGGDYVCMNLKFLQPPGMDEHLRPPTASQPGLQAEGSCEFK